MPDVLIGIPWSCLHVSRRSLQYFERARLEHHPEHAGTPHEVLLGQFGRRILAESTR